MKNNQKTEEIKVEDLTLWTENPRDPIDTTASDKEIILRAMKKETTGKWKLKKLLKDMGTIYDLSELPTVVKIDGKNIVYDGNRRMAILKLAQDDTLYQDIRNKLFNNEIPDDFKERKTILCNVCDKETALNNVERKHKNNGSWERLELDYFLYQHRNRPKSDFLILNEETKIIENNDCMNQGFIKDEVFSVQNLNDLGIYIENDKIKSDHDYATTKKLFDAVIDLVQTKKISTRTNNKSTRVSNGKLKDVIIEHHPDLSQYIASKGEESIKPSIISNIEYPKIKKQNIAKRKTKVSSNEDTLFGEKLVLEGGRVNELYCAIDKIYIKYKDDINIEFFSIIAMSLRLLLETAARVKFEKDKKRKISNEDNDIYKNFMSEAKKHFSTNEQNLFVLTDNWLKGEFKADAILHKYAHGELDCDKTNIIKLSKIVATILNLYFKRDAK
ncbi:MAG: hypothetical protein JJV93_02010 [Alphaproteobacteria bacterium]|nr:hypothetical protein [Alphaproteobacteria bacterium]MBL0718015.1 hypothetical protein [Alphaproteobacteria bacterium]